MRDVRCKKTFTCKEIRSKRKEFIHFYISYAVIPSQIYTSLRDFRLSNAEDQGVQLRRNRGSGLNYIRDAHPLLK